MLFKLFPGLLWLQGYTRTSFKDDLLAGLTIGVLLIPQSMGYAMVAGLPPEVGLYAAIFPPVIYALLGSSNKVSIGPVALDAILILSGLSLLAEPGSQHYLQLAFTLTLLVGLLQFAFGLLRLGFIANFLSYPVIVGYTSAAAVIIMASQLQSLVGMPIANGHFLAQLYELLSNSAQWNQHTLILGLSSLVLIFLSSRYTPKLPIALILLVLGMLLSGLLQLSQYGVASIASIPQGLPLLALPTLDWQQISQLLPVAFTVAFMGYVGSISIAKSQEQPGDKHLSKPNQELIALGLANTIGALFRAFPVSASFSRSAAFVKAGAQTQVAAIISAVFIAFILLFLTPLFTLYPLPKTILAAIIIMSVLGLFKYSEMKSLLLQDKKEFLSLLVTFVITLALGVQQGLLAGVAVSIMVVVYRSAIPHMTELGLLEDRQLYRNISRFKQARIRAELLIFRFDAPLYFANSDYFTSKLYSWIKQRPSGSLKVVIFDAESVNSIDSTAIKMLDHVIESLQQQGIELYLSHLIGPVRDALLSSPLAERLAQQHIFATTADAVAYFDKGEQRCADIALQTNKIK